MLVLFDIDGTLLHGASSSHLAALAEAVRRVIGRRPQLHVDDDGYRVDGICVAGMVDPQIIGLMLTSVGAEPDPVVVRRITTLSGPCYREQIEAGAPSGSPLPGARELVGDLTAAGVTVGVATGNVRRIAVAKLTANGFGGAFRVGAFGDGHRDRDSMVAEGCAHAERDEEVWVVGDTPADAAAARANGARVLAVTTGGFGVADLADADVVVAQLDDPIVREVLLSPAG
jgi:phosphoglycolate phosphatase-like HAD superfamily hydrolase